jgi:putative PIN family toxin of toxin-antitoxin system
VRIVLDTNVLVSGLLSPGGPPGRIVDLLTTGRISLLFDDRILAEYRAVLARPRLRIEPAEAGAILDLITHEGLLTPAPPLGVELPDPDDLPFLEVAVAGAAEALVTGNARHFRPLLGEHAARVRSPTDFIAEYPTG